MCFLTGSGTPRSDAHCAQIVHPLASPAINSMHDATTPRRPHTANYTVLYTAQLNRKHPVYQDGTLHVRSAAGTAHTIWLLDERGRQLAGDRVDLPELAVYAGARGLTVGGQFRVDVQERVGAGMAVVGVGDTAADGGIVGEEEVCGEEPLVPKAPLIRHKRAFTPPSTSSLKINQLTHFENLYTADLHKKTRVWKDGRVQVDPATQTAVFFDEAGKQMHVKKGFGVIGAGQVFQTARFLIEVGGAAEGKLVKVEETKPPYLAITRRKPAISKSAIAGGMTMSATDFVKPSADENGKKPTVQDIPCIYTEDKQKKQKRWIDGVIKYDRASGAARFEDADSGTVILRRSIDADLLVDGYEFDSGRYRFQVTTPVIVNIEKPANVVKRPRLMSVKEAKSLKNRPVDIYATTGDADDEELRDLLQRPDPLLDMFRE